MRDEKTHYETLGVTTEASTGQIRKAARLLLQTHHPDRGGDPEQAAAINAAYAVLTDPVQRKQYDEAPATPTSDHAPDPDAYEDSWGTEQTWDPPAAEEDVLDVEVEEEPTPAPAPPADEDDSPPPVPPTTVRTAQRDALLLVLAPSALLLLATLAVSFILAHPSDSPVLGPAVGVFLGLVGCVLLRRRLDLHDYTPRKAVIASMTFLSGAAVAALLSTLILDLSSPGIYLGFIAGGVTFVGAWQTAAALTRHRDAERAIPSRGLRDDGTIFGSSTGDTAGELLNATIWSLLARSDMHAARGLQSSDPAHPFTKAILLGSRVALLRPVFLPSEIVPARGASFYWSPPSLFLRSGGTGVPTPVLRLELDHYRREFRNAAKRPKRDVREFLVIYQPPGSPRVELPAGSPDMPALVMGEEAGEVIGQFLTEDGPVHHVDHQAVVRAMVGLEQLAVQGQ